MYNELVSIIVPIYNVEKYLKETLEAVKCQTYSKWECICVDDCSSDASLTIAKEYALADDRYRIIELNCNTGAANARNQAIKVAKGRFLAFLDADDVWKDNKLEKQISFMIDNSYSFTCTSYGKIDENSHLIEKICCCKKTYEYDDLLKNCPGNSTVIYDANEIGKVYAEDIKRRNDFAMWLKVIKIAKKIDGLDEVLSYHRVRQDSISKSKYKLIKYQFDIYFRYEKISFFRSVYLVIIKIFQTFLGLNG